MVHVNENKQIRFLSLNLFLFFVAIYLLTASGLNFYHTDASQLRIDVTKSLVENFDVSITEGIVGLRGADGRKYSCHGIGSSIVAIPFYVAGKLMGIAPENAVSILNQLFGAATAVLIFLFSLSLGYSRRASLLVSIFYGLGTMAWPLAKQPFDHPIETFFILLSIYLMYTYTVHRKASYLVFSALSLGFAFVTRPTSLLVIPALFILMISLSKESGYGEIIKLMIRKSLIFSIALFPFLVLFFWYNYYRFGSVFETGYQLMAAHTGVNFFTGTPLLTGLSGFLISPGKGFFYYSPVAVLFVFSIKAFLKRHRGLGISFIFIIVSYILFLSKNIYWHGDFAWGPRYILVITPFLIIPIAELVDSAIFNRNKIRRLGIYSVFILSLIIQIAAVSVDFHRYFNEVQFKEKVNFTKIEMDGFMLFVIPPKETYFVWNKSPILAQFKFIREIAGKIKEYRYARHPENTSFSVEQTLDPRMHVFDFWWVYKYFIDRNYSGFIVALSLLIVAFYSAARLYRAIL